MIPSFTNHLFISFASPSLGPFPAFFFFIDLQVLLLHFKGLSSLSIILPQFAIFLYLLFIYSFFAASGWVLAVAWIFPCSSQASL